MSKSTNLNRRKFLQLSAAASAGTALGCNKTAFDFPQKTANLTAVGNGFTPRKLNKKPNVLIAVLDDVGFADLGCYGSELQTKCMDELATNGTRFNNFHVTALCAPTRACLLTGRNAHAVGVGNIAEWGRDHPGYKGWIRQDAATLAEILKPEGYSTLALGKWHLSSLADQNATGPFDHWPNGRGFDRWYGFHGNAMDHWHPEMFENTVAAYPDKSDNYHLSTDLARRGVEYLQDHLAATPENPFLMYMAFGACHFPLHAPSDDIRRHKGKYDEGYEVARQKRFKKQKELGIIPENTELSPLNPNVTPWSDLNGDEKKLVTRGQEIYAAFLEHTDAALQQIVDFLKAEDIFDDTIVLVLSDNGAAPGSAPIPSIDVRRISYLGPEPFAEKMALLDSMGTDDSYGGSSTGWSQVSNTPLKWYKADTYGGGTRAPLIMNWGNGQLPQNQICEQYHHVIDIVPTLLDLINQPFPSTVNHQDILPIQGTSFAYAFDTPKMPTRKEVQYFETLGDRAIWVNGWKAVTRHKQGDPFDKDIWELYHIENDFAEINNLADSQPEKLQALINIWFQEAERYDILPMDDDTIKLYAAAVPPAKARYYFFPGMTRLDRLSAPDIFQYNSHWKVEVDFNTDKSNGVILSSGDSGAGYELYMKDGFVIFSYTYVRKDVTVVQSTIRISKGKHTITLQMKKTGDRTADITLLLADTIIGQGQLPRMWEIYTPNSGLRCGENRHAPISRDYEPPFVLEGLEKVVIDVKLQG
ncbi:MAG: sulfatase-like hydrolase/transferase [Saprospiraceae bacterium]